MISSYDFKKAIIFSHEKWEEAGRSQKIHILKSLKKEIAKDLGINPKIKLSKWRSTAQKGNQPRACKTGM